jgi:CRP/FNR family transcriptional regulator, cyclic AMP receptor protein
MAQLSLTRALGQIDLFAGVPDDVLGDLVAAGTTLTVAPGGTVTTQDSSDAGLQVVLEGSVDVDVNGVARPPIEAGGYFGEISLIDGQGRSANVTAGDAGVTTFAISQLSFSPLIDKHPSLSRALLRVLCARIRSLEESS